MVHIHRNDESKGHGVMHGHDDNPEIDWNWIGMIRERPDGRFDGIIHIESDVGQSAKHKKRLVDVWRIIPSVVDNGDHRHGTEKVLHAQRRQKGIKVLGHLVGDGLGKLVGGFLRKAKVLHHTASWGDGSGPPRLRRQSVEDGLLGRFHNKGPKDRHADRHDDEILRRSEGVKVQERCHLAVVTEWKASIRKPRMLHRRRSICVDELTSGRALK